MDEKILSGEDMAQKVVSSAENTSTTVESSDSSTESSQVQTSDTKTKQGATEKPKEEEKKFDAAKFMPTYGDEAKKQLAEQTALCQMEIDEYKKKYPKYVATYADGSVASINLTGLRKEGVELYTPAINRIHGCDETKTGESIMRYGAQHSLMVMTVGMAKLAGFKIARFPNDPDKAKPISDSGLVIIDGNGRIDYLLSVPIEHWIEVVGHFPMKDRAGFYNLGRAFTEINVNVAKWKTQDMVMKRQIEDGAKAHDGWKMVTELVNKGYMYQAACQLATLETDRIKNTKVVGGSADDVFTNFDCAKQIYAVLKNKFGESTDKTIKTKEFTKEISFLWKKLNNKQGSKWATEMMIKFLNGLSEDVINSIKNAKKDDYRNKDEQRKKILNDKFNYFLGSEKIVLD